MHPLPPSPLFTGLLMRTLLCLALSYLFLAAGFAGAAPSREASMAALQPLQDLIGSWRGPGEPSGSREDKQKGFWSETSRWEWQFKGNDVWLRAVIDKGKHVKAAELRYLADRKVYQLTVEPVAGAKQVYTGTLQNRRLTLERGDDT